MSPLLLVHIGAGSLAIVSGAGAVCASKGERLHRAFGTVFLASMLLMSALGTYLAVLMPQRASVAVGTFTFYLVATAWMTVRRPAGTVGAFEPIAMLVALGAGVALLAMGLRAAHGPTGLLDGAPPVRYYVFAFLGAFAAALDLKVILQGGISGVPRIARHLWRMCLALFFAASFFFLGQQKVMPPWLRGSPLLFVPAFAPVLVMAFWLVRVRVRNWGKARATPA